MQRNTFLKLAIGAAGASALGCASGQQGPARAAASSPARPPRRKIAAICFDLFTLFDPRSVVEVARGSLGEGAPRFCEVWRTRQFEYAWQRAAAGQYRDFRVVTLEALDYTARAHGLTLSAAQRESLVEAYSQLKLWPDARQHLIAWKRAKLRLAPLANYSPLMLQRLLEQADLDGIFDDQISTDEARTYKPDPRAYALGVSRLGLGREQIAFSAFGGWDAAGARWFGYPTFWVNRLKVAAEELAPGPDATGPGLAELAKFVAEW